MTPICQVSRCWRRATLGFYLAGSREEWNAQYSSPRLYRLNVVSGARRSVRMCCESVPLSVGGMLQPQHLLVVFRLRPEVVHPRSVLAHLLCP
ncbi:hypothetical protein J6590_002822 [Homalodisca vitripennis]|nr:hypothetical protein J6590_002822 [Homalodisca vitripennis]